MQGRCTDHNYSKEESALLAASCFATPNHVTKCKWLVQSDPIYSVCVFATGWQAEQWGSKEGQRWGRSRVAQGCMVLEGHRQVCCPAQQMSAPIMSCLLIDKVRLLFPDGLAWLCLLHLKTSLCRPAAKTIQRCRDRVRSPTHGCHCQPASPHEIALLR